MWRLFSRDYLSMCIYNEDVELYMEKITQLI